MAGGYYDEQGAYIATSGEQPGQLNGPHGAEDVPRVEQRLSGARMEAEQRIDVALDVFASQTPSAAIIAAQAKDEVRRILDRMERAGEEHLDALDR